MKLEFTCRSRYFRFTPEELKKISGDRDLPVVELPENAASDRDSAVRIKNFFKMYRDEKGTKKSPRFRLSGGAEAITLEKGTLIVSAPDAKRRYELTDMLLSVLDGEYPHFGKIGVWPAEYPRCGETRKMRQKAGLTRGTQLMWDDPAHFMNRNFRLEK